MGATTVVLTGNMVRILVQLIAVVVLALPPFQVGAESSNSAPSGDPIRHEVFGSVSGSFEAALKKYNVPMIVADMVLRGFALDPDFPRRLPADSQFKLTYDAIPSPLPESEPRLVLNSVWVLADGKLHDLYRYGWRGLTPVFFNQHGRSLRELLLRMPVDDARISSKFGWREHPVLKQRKFHYGLDLAAPPGTPVRAAADGVVMEAGWKGNYGNYIRLRHSPRYDTGYAHLSSFVTTLEAGRVVKQGEMIGFVGMTGLATGPHLDFQLFEDGKQLNPITARPMIEEDIRDQLASNPRRVLVMPTLEDLE